ncbi:hypothetical protein A3Q56_04019, partial [Intoshia linei]
NVCGVEPIGKVKRWSKKYNHGMDGVDIFDRAASDYRPLIRAKKWYFPLMIHGINALMVYAWRMYQMIHQCKMPQLQFRRSVVLGAITTSFPRPITGPQLTVSTPSRFDAVDHVPISIQPRRCILCKKNCRIKCNKCQKALHINTCFQNYYSEFE